jgi:hypothetical protein
MTRVLSATLAAIVTVACVGAIAAMPGPAWAAKKKAAANSEKPLRGVIRWHGGYSYKASDTTGSTGSYWRFIDTDSVRQSPSGPFDHGFFFDSGIEPHGGQSPYQH